MLPAAIILFSSITVLSCQQIAEDRIQKCCAKRKVSNSCKPLCTYKEINYTEVNIHFSDSVFVILNEFIENLLLFDEGIRRISSDY